MSKKLIVVQGPTASGKTALAITLAKVYQTVILSADSRQFYREMSIGTAKPSLEEQDGIKHYFIDSHSIEEQLSSAQYEKQALQVLDKEFQNHETIILVGGSGMFINALCDGLDDIPTDILLRNELDQQVKNSGLTNLLEELKAKDPEFYREVDQNNPVRIIRAIEAIRLTGQKFSTLRKKEAIQRPFQFEKFVINLPREVLYSRINQRVDEMMQNGLLEEVKSLVPFKPLQTLNTVGYTEIFDYLDGKFTLDQAIEFIKQHTRNYAKRQLTWFRKDEKNYWLTSHSTSGQMEEILTFI